ncbi:hypothetical protein V5F44_20545 [Xanthobacter sp. V2C-8]|uniref:hypothetical protein n=1 Tax=Xanthobacter albus TaxID=3119929 RepID=UPI00372AEAC4
MSAESKSLSIISLGVSCQTAMQIRHHAKLIASLTGEDVEIAGEELEGSTFPFDWRIMPADAFCWMAENRQFFPKTPFELSRRIGEWPVDVPPHWDDSNSIFWHDFKVTEVAWDVEKTFDVTAEKYRYTTEKFLNRTKRSIFILSNTQNNLKSVVTDVVGLKFDFDRKLITRVRRSLEALFPKLDIELIVVAAPDRVRDDVRQWPAEAYVLDQSHLSPDDVRGDADKWEAIFHDYFARFPSAPAKRPAAKPLAAMRRLLRDWQARLKGEQIKSGAGQTINSGDHNQIPTGD